jgi:hypothetical protein
MTVQVAVTNHAVERYRLRVVSAAKLDDEGIRTTIRNLVEDAFERQLVRDHPGYPKRRMVPFKVGIEQMFLALGPNETEFPGDWAVIGVLFDRETGQKSIGTTVGELIPEELKQSIMESSKTPTKAKYLVRIGGTGKEIYEAKDDDALGELLQRRAPRPDEVEVFERKELVIRQVYVIEKK